jgi:predicted metalloprotease with PDZ domain
LTRRWLASLLTICVCLAAPAGAQTRVAYTVRIDTAHTDRIAVELQLSGAPETVRLALKVHPEYDARFWRYLEGMQVTGTADDTAAGAERLDSTLWRIRLPGGRGRISWRLRVPAYPGTERRAWQVFVRTDGALLNPPDIFLYLPDFPSLGAEVRLDVPASWRIASALPAAHDAPGVRTLHARDAATLLDSPILLGALRHWAFRDAGTTFHVHYWPLPSAVPFDTAAFIGDLRRLTHASIAVFGRAPVRDYHFLLQDGVTDALEHAASVTFGLPSEALARDVRARLPELAHEFFHTWNLVAIHPDTYGALSYQAPAPTTGLWVGEGVTLYYADALRRRAGLADSSLSRIDWLAGLLRNYYGAWWSTRVSPERASLAFGASPVVNPDATGGYYLQGELLGVALDGLLRDSTDDRRGLDDLMRALYSASHGGRGFTSASLARAADSVCRCRLDRFFADQVRGTAPIDPRPVLARLGLQILIDTTAAVDDAGVPLPDLRIGFDFSRGEPPVTLVVSNSASLWARAGLRTGDRLVSFDGAAVATPGEFFRALRALRIGDSVAVEVRRGDPVQRIRVVVAGYDRPRVRIVEAPGASREQLARRARWLSGW